MLMDRAINLAAIIGKLVDILTDRNAQEVRQWRRQQSPAGM